MVLGEYGLVGTALEGGTVLWEGTNPRPPALHPQPPPVDKKTHAYENITFPQLHLRAVKIQM